MSRRRSWTISAVAAALSCLLVYGVYVLQIKQVEWQKTVNVAVPKDFIGAGALLTSDLIEYAPVFAGSYRDSMFTDLGELLGQETLIPIGKGEPILRWKVDRFHLLPTNRQATFQIPKEYILSISNGIRAGDQVLIYVSDPAGASERLFAGRITVASVKSSSNAEIDSPEHSNLMARADGNKEKMYLSRREANAAIDQINLNLRESEWLTIDRICKSRRNKLVIAFTSASITGISSDADRVKNGGES